MGSTGANNLPVLSVLDPFSRCSIISSSHCSTVPLQREYWKLAQEDLFVFLMKNQVGVYLFLLDVFCKVVAYMVKLVHKSGGPLQSSPSTFATKNMTWNLLQLQTHDTLDQNLQEETILVACSGYHKKKCCVLVTGDSLLKGTEAHLCLSDRKSWYLCCLLEVKISDIAKKVPQLVRSKELLSAVAPSCRHE